MVLLEILPEQQPVIEATQGYAFYPLRIPLDSGSPSLVTSIRPEEHTQTPYVELKVYSAYSTDDIAFAKRQLEETLHRLGLQRTVAFPPQRGEVPIAHEVWTIHDRELPPGVYTSEEVLTFQQGGRRHMQDIPQVYEYQQVPFGFIPGNMEHARAWMVVFGDGYRIEQDNSGAGFWVIAAHATRPDSGGTTAPIAVFDGRQSNLAYARERDPRPGYILYPLTQFRADSSRPTFYTQNPGLRGGFIELPIDGAIDTLLNHPPDFYSDVSISRAHQHASADLEALGFTRTLVAARPGSYNGDLTPRMLAHVWTFDGKILIDKVYTPEMVDLWHRGNGYQKGELMERKQSGFRVLQVREDEHELFKTWKQTHGIHAVFHPVHDTATGTVWLLRDDKHMKSVLEEYVRDRFGARLDIRHKVLYTHTPEQFTGTHEAQLTGIERFLGQRLSVVKIDHDTREKERLTYGSGT